MYSISGNASYEKIQLNNQLNDPNVDQMFLLNLT